MYAAIKPITPEEVNIPTNITFAEQVERHVKLIQRLDEALKQIDADKKAAEAANSLKAYKVAEADLDNVKKVLGPHAVAEAKATELVGQGFILNAVESKVCRNAGAECVPVDAMTAMFFFVGENKKGLGPTLADAANKKSNTTVTVNGFDLTTFIQFLSDKPLDMATFGILPGIRDAIIPPTDTGEIAQMIRDPGRRSAEIVKDLRDSVIPKEDNGEGAKIIRDPIQCTVGRVFGGCN
ncbi:MAG: hypothetical protein ACREYF_12065 [Gammaproteobacteria bacterium]